MLRSAGARRLRRTLGRCPSGAKIPQRIASWAWDVTHEQTLSLANLSGGKAPVGALIGLFWGEFVSADAAQVRSVCACASVTALYLPFFVFECFWGSIN